MKSVAGLDGVPTPPSAVRFAAAIAVAPRPITVAPSIVTTCHATVRLESAVPLRAMLSVLVVVPGVTPQGDANVPRIARAVTPSSYSLETQQGVCSPAMTTKLLLQSTAVMLGAGEGIELLKGKLTVP